MSKMHIQPVVTPKSSSTSAWSAARTFQTMMLYVAVVMPGVKEEVRWDSIKSDKVCVMRSLGCMDGSENTGDRCCCPVKPKVNIDLRHVTLK